jgi:hypothetical protein
MRRTLRATRRHLVPESLWADPAPLSSIRALPTPTSYGSVDTVEFLRRFVQHILPQGFVRIRSYGLLAHRCRSKDMARCRAVLGASAPEPGDRAAPAPDSAAAESLRCRHCEEGRLAFVALLTPLAQPRRLPRAPP